MLVVRADAQREDCQRAAIVITRLPQIAACETSRIMTREHFIRHGATHVMTRDAGDWRIAATLDPDIDRPWRRRPAVETSPPAVAMPQARSLPSTTAETLDDDPALIGLPAQ